MTGYRFTEPAREDLLEIWEFIAHDDIDAADRVIAGLEKAAEKLASHPQLGRIRPSIAGLEVRFLSVGAHFLVYRGKQEPIEILRVLHGARDLDAILGEESRTVSRRGLRCAPGRRRRCSRRRGAWVGRAWS